MVDRNFKEVSEEEGSTLILRTQAYADLRQIAKRNLKEAERVLAESGYQLFKNTEAEAERKHQSFEESSKGSKGEK